MWTPACKPVKGTGSPFHATSHAQPPTHGGHLADPDPMLLCSGQLQPGRHAWAAWTCVLTGPGCQCVFCTCTMHGTLACSQPGQGAASTTTACNLRTGKARNANQMAQLQMTVLNVGLATAQGPCLIAATRATVQRQPRVALGCTHGAKAGNLKGCSRCMECASVHTRANRKWMQLPT